MFKHLHIHTHTVVFLNTVWLCLINVHWLEPPSAKKAVGGSALASTREVVAEQLQGENLEKLSDSCWDSERFSGCCWFDFLKGISGW